MAQVLPNSLSLGAGQAFALPGRATWRAAGWMSLLAMLAGLICLMYLITTGSFVGTGYDIQRLEAERAEWMARNEQLEYELAKVQSLTWVEAEAVNRLGMVKPKVVTYLHLERAEPLAPAPDPAETPAKPTGRADGPLDRITASPQRP